MKLSATLNGHLADPNCWLYVEDYLGPASFFAQYHQAINGLFGEGGQRAAFDHYVAHRRPHVKGEKSQPGLYNRN